MKFTFDKKSVTTVLSVVMVGVLLAAAILFWKRGDHGEAAEAGHGETATEEHGKEAGESDDHGKEAGESGEHDEGIVELTDEQIHTAGIATAKASSAVIGSVQKFPGEVRFNEDRTAHVVPRVAGVAESVSADLGQFVRKGQVLAVISSPELAELRSTALAANKRLGLARLTYEREKKLWEDKISAEQDYLQAQQAYREAEIAAQAASSKLAALGAGNGDGPLNRYVLRAPFDAMVVEKHVAQGESLKEDANVFLLSDLSTVWVDVVISAQDVEAVRIDTPVTVKSTATATVAEGKVSYVGALLGEETRTAKARVVLANPKMAWRPGLFVDVAMARGKHEVPVAVAVDALQTTEGKSVIYVRTPGGFKAQPVTVGTTDGKLVEITAGLTAGATYATTGSFVLKAEQGKGSAEHDH